jgi:16S rRNA C967 or C1407 C5-methylase (RsmB/RsmF family)
MAEDYRLPGLPRYLRVNTIKIGLGKVKKNLLQTGHHLCPDPKHTGHRAYFRDSDVPDLLVFKPKGQSDISRIPMVASGEVVVQQKASCFPAVALNPPIGGVVIDACAAPGNKTSHVAALMQNKGTVFAFEQNERRAQLLREMMTLKGASIVQTKHMSFLDADPDDPQYADVTHIMLDPSCSSSGMSVTPEQDPKRLQELADDQTRLVLHAMRFPAVVAVCYSTCSVHELENEQVVRRILRGQSTFGLAPAMPWWPRRGHLLEPDRPGKEANRMVEQISQMVVRTSYPDDATIGFFLARFERKDEAAKAATAAAAAAAAMAAGSSSANEAADGGEDHLFEAGGQMGSLGAKLAVLAKARKKEKKAKEREPARPLPAPPPPRAAPAKPQAMPTKPQAEQSKTHRQASTSDGQRAEEAHEDAPPSSAQGGNSGDAPQPSCGQKRSNSRQRKRKRERDAEQSERP